MSRNLGAVDYVKHYRVSKDPSTGDWRVVNTYNGILNKHIFKTRSEALVHARKLAVWFKGNYSPSGVARTAFHNKKITEQYHLSKRNKT